MAKAQFPLPTPLQIFSDETSNQCNIKDEISWPKGDLNFTTPISKSHQVQGKSNVD